MTTPEVASTQSLRPDEDIRADLWEAIEQLDTIGSTDKRNLSIAIHDSVVVLEGHMAGTFNGRRVENIARSVPGVNAVHNDLVVDGDLEIQVAQALARDARTRPYILRVGSYHGWIRLSGTVPCQELQSAAEAVAAGVPAVRGVIALPRVTGETANPLRRAVQPRPGARVHGDDGEVGVVAQVVINPQNRLVTHMVVSLSEVLASFDIANLRRVTDDYLVPIEAAEVVNKESVILTHRTRSITVYPLFDASAYPPPPLTWRPPYPYSPSVVRWPRPITHEPARWPEEQPALDLPIESDSAHLRSTLWSSMKERGQTAPQYTGRDAGVEAAQSIASVMANGERGGAEEH
jgi:osmotically-inducible protein OsmY